MYVVVYCGSALYSVILKRVVEEIITVSIKSPHFTATHITNEKFWAGQGGQVPPLDPPPPLTPPLFILLTLLHQLLDSRFLIKQEKNFQSKMITTTKQEILL